MRQAITTTFPGLGFRWLVVAGAINVHPQVDQIEAKFGSVGVNRRAAGTGARQSTVGALPCGVAPFRQYGFPAPGIRSLCWRGDELVDWVGGGRAFTLDGTERRASVRYAYRFDAATASRDGRVAVIYERLGTKGLLLKEHGGVFRGGARAG
jgi:hypothetical protein